MAPIKFEDDFKDKLEKRTIAPSKGAWDKLSERLEAEDNTSNNKGLWWIGIAASVIGVLFAVFQFSNNDIEVETVVDAPENIETIESKPAIEDFKTATETTVAVENIEQEQKKLEKNSTTVVVNKTKSNSTKAPLQIAKEEVVAKVKDEKDVLKTKQVEVLAFETEKAQEVADAIYKLSETKSGVSDTSIDSLLKAAQRDILLSRMKNEDQVLVDATLLLQEVEFELDQSFRDKVFKALKDSYGSVKTAIAQRND